MGGSELFSSSSLVEMAFPNILTGISVKVYPETELGCSAESPGSDLRKQK